MATLITHPAIPLAIGLMLGRKVIPIPLLLLGVLYSMLPDLDVITLRLGVPYGSPFGHRGFSHSIALAVMLAVLAVPLSGKLAAKPSIILLFLAVAMASHGMLDAMTNAGKGVEFFWPFSTERIFFDARPIEASPASLMRFMQGRPSLILRSEVRWVWLPAFAIAGAVASIRLWASSARR